MRSILFPLLGLIAAGCSIAPNPASRESSPGGVTPTAIARTLETASERISGGLIGGRLTDDSNNHGHVDGEPTAGLDPARAQRIPSGHDRNDVAARVALTAFNDSNWTQAVAEDLHPANTNIVAAQQLATPNPGPHRLIVLVAVEAHVDDPNILFVTFDELSGGEPLRHVTAITLTSDADRPLVLDVTPLS